MKYLVYAIVFVIETFLFWILAHIDEKVIFLAGFNWFVNLVIFGFLIERLFKTSTQAQITNKNSTTDGN